MEKSNDRMLIATTPAAMQESHGYMVEWCSRQIEACDAELTEARANLDRARESRWSTKPFAAIVKRAEERRVFLAKIRAAVEAGYYIVPNFLADAFAIRTDAKKPRKGSDSYAWSRHEQSAKRLPAEAGRYVSPLPSREIETWEDDKGRERKSSRPIDFRDVAFPMELAKPELLEATSAAMALAVFDEIAVARDYVGPACGDPMILGVVLNPYRGRPNATFFIGWALPLDQW